jgi:hypothetical protein
MWGKQSTFENLEINLRTADPEDGCETYNFNQPRSDTAYLVTGLKSCSLSNLIHNAQTHGAKALFIVNNKDTELDEIVMPDHLSGVQIHVFIVKHSDGVALIDTTRRAKTEDEKYLDSKVQINFIDFVQKTKSVELELVHTPENPVAVKFLADLFESKFSKDIGSKINLNLRYAMMHCAKCQEQGYKLPKSDCLSGGRYCWKGIPEVPHSGEVVLVQMIKNMCVSSVLKDRQRAEDIGNYYWLYHKNCMTDLDPKCSNSILKSLGIKDLVFDCISESFEQSALQKGTRKSSTPNIVLQDNKLLREEKERFKKIEHYAHFPLLKVNGMVYSAPITFGSVLGFVCTHINDGLEGCNEMVKVEEVVVSTSSRTFEWIFFTIILGAVVGLIVVCRNQLRRKFDSELSYKIDQSITQYLQRTGTEL